MNRQLVFSIIVSLCLCSQLHAQELFDRGDANGDGQVDISDPVFVLGFLFLGGTAPSCGDAADANDDGNIDISDSVGLLRFLFMGSAAPPLPFGECGADSTPGGPGCERFPPCEGEKPGILPGARFLVDITSARSVTLPTVVIAPKSPPTAAVILLEGDVGVINLGGTPENPEIESQGFLARNADLFASGGLLVALVGAPSDYEEGIDLGYRVSAEQSEDVAAVIDWIDDRVSLPVWVLGMSLGSYSATNSAIRLNRSLDGYAVCSASTAPTGGPLAGGGILLMPGFAEISMPALVVGHAGDECPGTPSAGVALIAEALTGASPIAQRVFTGGSPRPEASSCGPVSHHGYYGIEDEVVTYMACIIASPAEGEDCVIGSP
jgi:hypothetical protein